MKANTVYPEKTVITVKMGEATNQIYVENGTIYAKASAIMRHIGYQQGVSTQYVVAIGAKYFKKIPVGAQEHWFIDVHGFSQLLQHTKMQVGSAALSGILRMYGVEQTSAEDNITYRFSDHEMLAIFDELLKSPVNKLKVQQMLLSGKK